MNDYLNITLAEIKCKSIIDDSITYRKHFLKKKETEKISEKLILKMADYLIETGTKIKEHHPMPKGA